MENPLIGKSFRCFSDSNGADSSGSNFHSAILSGFRSGSSESRSFLCRKIIIHFHSADRVSLNFDFDHEEVILITLNLILAIENSSGLLILSLMGGGKIMAGIGFLNYLSMRILAKLKKAGFLFAMKANTRI